MNKKILFVLISVCCNWGCTQNQLICTGEATQVSFETVLSSSISEIGYGIATHPIDVYYFAVIPKILPETRIDFNIVYLN